MSTSPPSPRHARARQHLARPEPPPEAQPFPIVERPDGYYWVADGDLGEFGPFETYGLARTDLDAGDVAAAPSADSLHEAERQVGIADWIDEQTGAPAEGGSPPHLQEE